MSLYRFRHLSTSHNPMWLYLQLGLIVGEAYVLHETKPPSVDVVASFDFRVRYREVILTE